MEDNFAYLFDRPSEPIFIPKGEDKVNIEIPNKYLPDEYKPLAEGLQSRFDDLSENTIRVPDIAIPDLSIPLSLDRSTNFSLFVTSHREKAIHLLKVFLGLRTKEDLFHVAAICRDRMNQGLYNYALSVAILHRPDTKNTKIPELCENFPNKFFDSAILTRAKRMASVINDGSRIPIEIPLNYTASDKDPEHRVAYFREDVGVNLHHWHWHLIYPFQGPNEVVKKDRRGEIFYYMHHQIIARYNIERFCNYLPRTKPYENLRETIPEAYFPKMDQVVAARAWPSRPANMKLSDVDRPIDKEQIRIAEVERHRKNILNAIETRQVRNTKGEIIDLDEVTGIDILGNLLEASPNLTPDANFYGNMHNDGHSLIAYCHDPDHRYLESFGVMGDPTTSMRDPWFYRWHQYIDDLCIKFKDSLEPYNINELLFNGVTVTSAAINSATSNPNTLNTHWAKSDIDLSRGLDFTPRGAVLARVQHLDHDEFSYVITANNNNNGNVIGTVRIFAAPRFDELRRPLSFEEQRILFIEMDKFTVTLKKGQNTIKRRSSESAITITNQALFRNLNFNRPDEKNRQAISDISYCGCGWPQYMLVPKGTPEGFAMDLFVMISDYEQDKVDQEDPEGCRTGVSFCGLRDRKYPDARAMGYPFDRKPRVSSMDQFRTSNMFVQQITVRFSNTIKEVQI